MKFSASRLLTDESPRRVYKPSSSSSLHDVVVKGLHYGQRKLLLSEIEFLSAYHEADSSESPPLVVYAGAANGSHLPFIFRLFPGVRFVLIDPAPFCAQVRDIAQCSDGPIVELVEGYCTDELCRRLAHSHSSSYKILLISDIRSGVPAKLSNKENTAMIMRDNKMQQSWCWSLGAEAALLKFHPPYPRCNDPDSAHYDASDDTPNSVEYLDGERLFGVWAPKSSSEVRLCVRGPFSEDVEPRLRHYDCVVHEEQCYYYNTDGRYARDCKAEREILNRYLELFPGVFSGDVVALSSAISEFLRFPMFRPLDPSFSEDDARWVTLLYSVGDQACLDLFDTLRGHVSLKFLQEQLAKWHTSASVPEDVTAGSVKLTRDFWRVICTGSLSEAYGIPPVRCNFAHVFVSRKRRRAISLRAVGLSKER
ncbi:hypothetical protein TRVL_03534 [Trypanosoma vivax]|nr:hypothetical protein TRVL_03534 [Trypanosoma vivax]